MQARKILQEQEEYFSGCSEMFVKTIRKWIQLQEKSNVLFLLKGFMVKWSILKNLDLRTWPKRSESCKWDYLKNMYNSTLSIWCNTSFSVKDQSISKRRRTWQNSKMQHSCNIECTQF
jgi:hypothetical protein